MGPRMELEIPMKDYEVYALLDPRKPGGIFCGVKFRNLPKYIGKGRGARAKTSAFREANYTNSPKARWVRRLRQEGYEPILVFVKRNMRELDAFELERELIKGIGRKLNDTGPLLNRTGGGEGGKHVDKQFVKEYKALLKTSNLQLLEPLRNRQEYHRHFCQEHGEVSTAPQHVMGRIRRGKVACPKCGVASRGKTIAVARNKKGKTKYLKFFEQHCTPEGYKITGKFSRTIDNIKHWCPVHGTFEATPRSVISKVTSGLTCCPLCNRENQPVGDKWSARQGPAKENYKELLQDTGYKLVDKSPFSMGAKLKHRCPSHGSFVNTPTTVKQNLKNGRTPCPHCNIEIRNAKNVINSAKGGEARRKKIHKAQNLVVRGQLIGDGSQDPTMLAHGAIGAVGITISPVTMWGRYGRGYNGLR